MKILKFSGIVAGVHVLFLILIFANPGCSSSSKPAPSPADTVASSDTPTITVAGSSASPVSGATSGMVADPVSITAAVRYSPTRPNTAAASSLQAAPVADVVPASTYAVAKNDNLTVIAKRNHLTVAELAAANNLTPNARLSLGQKLIIPSKVAPAVPPSSAKAIAPGTTAAGPTKDMGAAKARPAGDAVTHVVQPGETLSVIARKYGVKQADIAVANNITDPEKVRAGVELTIPGWQATAGKNAKAGAGSVPSAPPPATIYTDPNPVPAAPVPVIRVDDAPATP